MINKGFFSETFLEEYKNTKLTELQKEYIENFSYGLSILKEDLSEENKSRANKIYLTETFERVLQGLDFNDFNIENDLFVLYGSKNTEKDAVIVIDFVTSLEAYSDYFGEYKEIKAINYAKEKNIKLAVITDGFKWRVYRLDVANYFETYIELDIKDYSIHQNLDDANMKLFIDLFYGQNYIITEDEKSYYIDTLFEKNDKVIENIEKELKNKMEDILSGIGLGFKEHIGKENFEDQERKELYRDSITVLYRTLFILYAEKKCIFNVEDKIYKENSLSNIIDDIPSLVRDLDKIGNEYTLWERLSTLFTWINEGKKSPDFNFTAYNGGLFSNQNRNILSNNKINNRNLVKALGMLGYYGKDDYSVKINFNDITTRSFGTLYEGILDYNMFIAEEKLLKRIEKNKVLYIPLKDANAKKTEEINIIEKGQIYLSGDAHERKETGAYYTPEPIVEYIVSNTVDIKVKEKLDELQNLLNPILEDLKTTVNPLLENALKIKVVDTIERYIKENILTLSVLDNAMGSGHFLVNAAYHISNLIFSFIHKNISFSVDDFENLNFTSYQYWKRQVVSHNIYGVDINELAVQLGKLSLWLISASKDKPLSFIDHHIKCGNSLIGTSSKDIDEVLGERVGLFDTSLNDLMQKLENMYIELEKMPENIADEVHDKEKYYEEILNELEIVKKKWDIFLAMKLIDKKGKVDNIAYTNIASSSYDLEKIENEYRVHYEQWEELSRENQFFHWELEFPEVFNGKEKGFDCIIGNPPYVFTRSEKINKNIKYFLNASYPYQNYQLNLYSIFMEKSFYLLNTRGAFGYITPNNWLSIDTLKPLRDFIISKASNILIVNQLYKTFATASVDTALLIFLKDSLNDIKLIESKSPSNYVLIKQLKREDLLSERIINFKINNNSTDKFIIDKINNTSKEIDEIFIIKSGLKAYELGKGVPAQTEEMKRDRIYHSKHQIDSSYIKYLEGKDVNRYCLNFNENWLKYGSCLAAPRTENIFKVPRIIVRQIPSTLPYCINATYCDEFILNDINSMIIYSNENNEDLLYFLGLLNSKLYSFWFDRTFDKFQRKVFPQFKVKELKTFPFIYCDEDKYNTLVNLVKEILVTDNSTNKSFLSLEIDKLVYKIFSITEEEIKIIEESIK